MIFAQEKDYVHCVSKIIMYTVSQKKVSTFKLCNFVKSSPIVKSFAVLESVWNLLQNLYDTTHLTLANKLHFKCTDFNSSMRVTVYAECICIFINLLSSSLNTMLIVDKHCSNICCGEFPAPQIDWKSKQVKQHWHAIIICNQRGANLLL